MKLSSDLISQFVKATKDEKKTSTESTVFGTTVEYDGSIYVKLDGSDLLTPVTTTADMKPGERVTVLLKNHTATVTGNMSSPAARTDRVEEIGDQISDFEIIVADKVSTKELTAQISRIDQLYSDNITITGKLDSHEASIDQLEAEDVSINGKLTAANASIENLETKKLDTEIAEATYATIKSLEAVDAKVYNLDATYGDFVDLTTKKFNAHDASIDKLEAEKLSAESAELMYANIDFANIGKAAIENFFSKSGMIGDLVVGDGAITGTLVGVTIKGDLIEGGTVVADKLVIKGTDGLYYKLNTDGVTTESEQTDYNSLNGSIITAKSITATKISVDDLVAFGATIGGFHITDDSLYSGVKESVDNTTRGIYLDNNGQANFGDSTNFFKFYEDTDGSYKLIISADTINFGASGKSVETAIEEVSDAATEAKETAIEIGDSIRAEMIEQNAEIIATSESIVLNALENYVATGDYEAFKSTVESQLSVMADEITMSFTTVQNQITEVDDELQNEITERSKYFTFTEDGLLISAGGSFMTLRLDNDMIMFEKNGSLFGWWDGINFHTGNIVVDLNERAQFGNFAYIPRSDGSLSFLKVANNIGFYHRYFNEVLKFYGVTAYLDDTTLVFEGITGTLTDGTLTFGG